MTIESFSRHVSPMSPHHVSHYSTSTHHWWSLSLQHVHIYSAEQCSSPYGSGHFTLYHKGFVSFHSFYIMYICALCKQCSSRLVSHTRAFNHLQSLPYYLGTEEAAPFRHYSHDKTFTPPEGFTEYTTSSPAYKPKVYCFTHFTSYILKHYNIMWCEYNTHTLNDTLMVTLFLKSEETTVSSERNVTTRLFSFHYDTIHITVSPQVYTRSQHITHTHETAVT